MNQKGFAPILIVIILAALVGGYLLYQKQVKPVAVPQQVQVTPAPTTKNESTGSAETGNPDSIRANWKIYTRPDFSLKLPEDWQISAGSSKDEQFDASSNQGKLKIQIEVFKNEVYKNAIGTDLREYLNGMRAERYQKGLGDKVWQETSITVDRIKGVKIKTSTPGFSIYIQPTNNKLITISLSSDTDDNLILVDQILATFKFIQ